MTVGPPSPSSALPHDRRFWVNFISLCLVLALAEAARGIVLPTLSLYVASLGGSPSLLAVVVAAFSVGRLTSSVVYGYLSDRYQLHVPLMGSLMLGCVGHVLFILPPYVGSAAGLPLLIVARLLTGFATGTLSLARAFTSRETAKVERTRFMSWLGIVQFAGFAFTPILGGIPVNWQLSSSWTINTYVAGTYFLLLLDVALIGGLWWGMARQGGGGAASEVEEVPIIQLTVCTVSGKGDTVGHVQSGRTDRTGSYSAVLEGDDPSEREEPQLSSHSQMEAEDESWEEENRGPSDSSMSHEATAASVKPLHSIPFSASAASALPVIVPSQRSLRSLSIPLSHVDAVIPSSPLLLQRGISAPATVDLRPIRREELSSTSIVSLAPSEGPTLISASWRSSPLFTPVLFTLLNATCRGCLAVSEAYGSTLYYTAVYGAHYDPTTVSTLGAAWFYTILGGVGVAVFVLMDKLTHLVNELTLLVCGFIAMSLGFLLSLDFDHDLKILELSASWP